MAKEDDPKKCTASKLIRFNLAEPIFKINGIPKNSIVLNPFSENLLSKEAKDLSQILVAIDCSWNKASNFFKRRIKGYNFRLPKLLASNPIHYGHISVLSTVEALAGALYILGYKERARLILSKFKWGLNFLILNEEPLEAYSKAKNSKEIIILEEEFFGKKFKSKEYNVVRD
ncbi:hypothetical protein HRbin06_00103 [archaeon HR06]|nr:hypothetical protein HRbin06_00103 [archaeon HR06]